MDGKLSFILLFTVAVLATDANEDLKCQGMYYRAGRIQSEPMGFCWYFLNGNYTLQEADKQCARHVGRLPAINSDNKAAKLANFSAAVRHLYLNGSYHMNWVPVYAAGWKGNVIWGDRIIKKGNQQVWKVTGAPVSYQGFDETTNKWNIDESCTTFDIFTGKWRYASCSGVNTVMCEEDGHEYQDEPPTDVKRTYLAENCPRNFQLENGRCTLIGRISGIYAANIFCNYRGGHLAVVTSENDEKTLGQIISDKRLARWPYHLSPIVLRKGQFMWETTGQSAEYVAKKLKLVPEQSFVYNTLIVFDARGKLQECKRWKCNARAFCQANSEDYYAYAGDYNDDDDY